MKLSRDHRGEQRGLAMGDVARTNRSLEIRFKLYFSRRLRNVRSY